VAVEIARHIPRLATQRRLDPAPLFAALQVMPIEWRPAADYDDRRQDAEQRIAARDPDDCADRRPRSRARSFRSVFAWKVSCYGRLIVGYWPRALR
jgi:hypothetical protein